MYIGPSPGYVSRAIMSYAGLQDRVYDSLASSTVARAAALWLRNVATQILRHRLAPSICPEYNGEALLQRELAPELKAVFDVGANRVAPSVERVVCYEPSLSALGQLRERFALNHNVEIVDAAVADSPGTRDFFEEPDGGETSSLLDISSTLQLRDYKAVGTRQVRVVTLDDEIERHQIEHIDLLKIDTEGMDLHVLRGARQALSNHRITTIQFEYGGAWAIAGSTLISAFSLLHSHGYSVYALLPDGLYPYEPAHIGELFVYANFIALLPGSAAETLSQVHGRAL